MSLSASQAEIYSCIVLSVQCSRSQRDEEFRRKLLRWTLQQIFRQINSYISYIVFLVWGLQCIYCMVFSFSKGLFGMLHIDPEKVLVILTTTRIPDRISRTGTFMCGGWCADYPERHSELRIPWPSWPACLSWLACLPWVPWLMWPIVHVSTWPGKVMTFWISI